MELGYFSSTQEPPYLSPEEMENSGTPLSPSITSRLFYLALAVDRYYTPVLFVFGVVGNGLSIIVFFSKSHNARGSLSSTVYLSALAISDTGFLINLFIMWLDNMGTSLLTNSFMCKTVMYTGQVTGFLSVWLIVAFTVERFCAVCYPLFKPSKCTASRARKIALGLTLFAAVGFSYVLFIADVQKFHLNPKESGGENSTFKSPEVVSHESMLDLSTLSSSRGHGMQSDELTDEDNQFSIHGEIFSSHIHQSPVKHERDEKGTTAIIVGVSDTENKNLWKSATKDPTSKHEEQDEPPEFAYMCSVAEEYHGVSRIYSYLDSVITFIVPFVLIAVLNLKIIFCVKKIKGHRESMLANSKLHHYRHCHKPQHPMSHRQERKGTLKDFFNKFHYIKKPAGPQVSERKCRKSRDAMNCRQRQPGEESTASCSNSQNLKYHPEQGGDDNCNGGEAMTSLLESVPSIESDSPSSPGAVTPPNFKPITNLANHNATEIRVTKTLLLVSSVFLLLHFPSHSIRVAAFIVSISSESKKETFQQLNVAQHWANILFNTNFAINFLLYCCSGKKFRLSVRNLFTKDFLLRRHQNRSPRNASTTVLTTQLTLQPDSASTSGKYSNIRIQRHQCETGMEEDQL